MIGKNTIETKETKSLQDGDSEQEGLRAHPSWLSGKQTKDSKQTWQKPKDLIGLARQVNTIATQVLNEEIDLEKARTFGALTRVIAQIASNETTKARFAGGRADFDLDDAED